MAFKRIIGDNYLTRWHLVPRNRLFGIFLHRFTGSDDDRAAHDHPWPSVSILLKGTIREHIQVHPPIGVPAVFTCWYPRRFRPVFRSARHSHIIKLEGEVAWTLFLTGPVLRHWGYWCPKGWLHHDAYDKQGGCK